MFVVRSPPTPAVSAAKDMLRSFSMRSDAEIVAAVTERLQGVVDVRVRRMGFAPVVCPTTKPLENLFYPDPRRIASAAWALVHGKPEGWTPTEDPEPEAVEFKGPF